MADQDRTAFTGSTARPDQMAFNTGISMKTMLVRTSPGWYVKGLRAVAKFTSGA
jgi:hypothetical protein